MSESRAEKYRRQARDCLETVKAVSTDQARQGLIEMARVWARLADQAAGPVVQQQQQQQQQAQPKKDE